MKGEDVKRSDKIERGMGRSAPIFLQAKRLVALGIFKVPWHQSSHQTHKFEKEPNHRQPKQRV